MGILIKGGHVINPATKMDEVADVRIEEDKIAEIGKNLKVDKTDRVIEAKGCYVMPGFIDMHVHFRDPGFEQKEDIFTGMSAAAHGGYTTVLTMPNTKPVVDNADVVEYVHKKAESGHCIHVLQVGAVTKGQKGQELADIKGMVEAGIPAISEDGKSVMNAEVYREGMLEAAKYGIPVLAHCEDINMVHGGVMNADEKAKELGMPGITNSVEDVIIARDIVLSKETGAQLHLCHCSTEDSVKMVKLAKEEGLNVSAEVCPHHFTLTSDDIKKFVPQIENGILIPHETDADTNYKMNPPLRTENDRQQIIAGLADGTIDLIATDHAPHSTEEKSKPITEAPSGIIGLETSLALGITNLVKPGYLTMIQLLEKMTVNPAKLYHLPYGTIQEGADADFVIFDPDETWIPKEYASKSSNSPFTGEELTGKVKYTICGGNIVYSDIK